jgi:hypothetical protein
VDYGDLHAERWRIKDETVVGELMLLSVAPPTLCTMQLSTGDNETDPGKRSPGTPEEIVDIARPPQRKPDVVVEKQSIVIAGIHG